MNQLFETLWNEQSVPMVTQEPHELYAAFCMMRGYESFLEVGSCYGTSLYILGHALKPGAEIVSVDLCEKKSAGFLKGHVAKLNNRGYKASIIEGDSKEVYVPGKYDVVFIDGDHSYDGVMADVAKYRPYAKQMFMMHDIRLDGPKRVFEQIGGGLRVNCDHRNEMAPDTGFGIIWV